MIQRYETWSAEEVIKHPNGGVAEYADHIAEMRRVKSALRECMKLIHPLDNPNTVEVIEAAFRQAEIIATARAILAEDEQ